MCCTSVAEFAEVCQKEITKFEADIELDTFDGKTVQSVKIILFIQAFNIYATVKFIVLLEF
jgi:hypothetical protein